MSKIEQIIKNLLFDDEETVPVEKLGDEELVELEKKIKTELGRRAPVEKEEEESEPEEYNAPGRGNANEPLVAFVGASPSKIDFIRKKPFSGFVGKTMSDTYLPPLGLTEDDVYMTNIVKEFCFDGDKPTDPTEEKIAAALPDFVDEMKHVKPRFIVALGKTAKDAIGMISQEWCPHPRAINMNSDSGEVDRKMSRLKKRIAEPDATMEGVVIKSGDEKQVVYGVVMEPLENDTDNNWSTPDQIEEASHLFMKHFQSIDVEHSREDIEAYPVESYIAPEDTVIGGKAVKAGSWVMGVKIDDPSHWQSVKDGEYTGFSIDATARIDPNVLLE